MRRVISNKPKKKVLTLREFYEKRNQILIIRQTGGLGDILMHRMMFEDFHDLMPEAEIHFALPPKYYDAVYDHPFINKVLDSRSVNRHEYNIYYETTSACTRHEMMVAPLSHKNRSDIWANHCGVELQKHNMHIRLEETYKAKMDAKVKKLQGDHKGVRVCFAPVSAMATKNLLSDQIKALVNLLRSMGCFLYALHHRALNLDMPVIYGTSIREWMAAIDAADYVISVDTAQFHYAGGVGKPLMGIFTFADGKVYGKYYDFVLIQKHRDNGDWDCGPCYNWPCCPKSKKVPKPCLTEISKDMLVNGVRELMKKWPQDSIKALNSCRH